MYLGENAISFIQVVLFSHEIYRFLHSLATLHDKLRRVILFSLVFAILLAKGTDISIPDSICLISGFPGQARE